MTIGRLLAAAALCAPLLLTGCSDNPEPKMAPPTSSPSSSSPTTTEPQPAAWEEKTRDGAAAFAEHWVSVFSNALKGEDTSELRGISAPNCRTCEAFAGRIEQIRANGGFYRTPGWRVLSAAPSRKADPPSAEVAMRVMQGRETFKEGETAAPESNPASRATYSATLRWVDGAWRMEELTLL